MLVSDGRQNKICRTKTEYLRVIEDQDSSFGIQGATLGRLDSIVRSTVAQDGSLEEETTECSQGGITEERGVV